jgi:GH25 family lysozyme M1 (1,4-beta-N-acetylmuramidase)
LEEKIGDIMIKGTDLSHWNAYVDYDAMVDYGIRFGCLKLGQGRLRKDVMFDTHAENFERLNVPWDFYWFCDYRYSGVANVQNLVSLAAGNYGRKHPVCDLEFYDGFGPRPDGYHMRRFALDFFGELEAQTTLLCMFYSNRDVINQIMAGISTQDKAEFLRHDLWLATDAPYGNPSPWPKYKLNQYELDFIVPWSHGTVDLDEFNGTEENYSKFYDTQPPPIIEPTHDGKVELLWDNAKTYPPPNWNL